MAKDKNIKERIIKGIFFDNPIHGCDEIKVGDNLGLGYLSSPGITSHVTNIIRIKDSGVNGVVDIHSDNWPGFNVSIISFLEDVEDSAEILSYLYVPEKRVLGISYMDIVKEQKEVEVTAE